MSRFQTVVRSRLKATSGGLPVHFPPDIDQGISIKRNPVEKQEAKVVRICPKSEIRLELSEPSCDDYQNGEQVWVQYREKGTIYCWNTGVVKVSGPDNRSVTLSIASDGMILQQRQAPRIRVPIPFSFVVTGASEPSLMNQKFHDCKVRDISVGGLRLKLNFR